MPGPLLMFSLVLIKWTIEENMCLQVLHVSL